MDEKKILVFYLDVATMESRHIEEYVNSIKHRFFDPDFIKRNNCEVIILPNRDGNTRLECINPVYVTDEQLIKEHEALMVEFNESLNKLIVNGEENV